MTRQKGSATLEVERDPNTGGTASASAHGGSQLPSSGYINRRFQGEGVGGCGGLEEGVKAPSPGPHRESSISVRRSGHPRGGRPPEGAGAVTRAGDAHQRGPKGFSTMTTPEQLRQRQIAPIGLAEKPSRPNRCASC